MKTVILKLNIDDPYSYHLINDQGDRFEFNPHGWGEGLDSFIDRASDVSKKQENCASGDVSPSLPDSEEITDAAMKYAEIEGDDPFNKSVRDAAHFVAGAIWCYKRVKGNVQE